MSSNSAKQVRRQFRSNKIAMRSPRRYVVSVVRSSSQCTVQLWDSEAAQIVCGANSRSIGAAKPGSVEGAKLLGKAFGVKLLALGVSEIHYNRRQYAYHGRVAALADGLREAGIKF